MKTFIAAIFALSLVVAYPARAEAPVTTADRADIQCLAIMLAVIGVDPDMDAEAQAGVAAGAMYYLGRLNGRSPDRDWLAYLTTYLESAPEEDFKTEGVRCGEEMTRVGGEMVEWGTALQKRYGEPKSGN